MPAMASENAFLNRVRDTVHRHALLAQAGAAEPEAVIVATSGGPDSVALILALHGLARSGLAVALTVAHLHHGLRKETADADALFVAKLAERLGLPFVTQRLDVPALAKRDGLGLEEAARNARRSFLADAARRAGARKVALGHTADDRAETVLFNIVRGTGVEGLAALPPQAPLPSPTEGRGQQPIEIIRPLIECSRAEVLAFLESRGEPWREDETNADTRYARNRLRREVLPLLREAINPKANEALGRLADQAAEAADVLADALDAAWYGIVREVPVSGSARRVSRPAAPDRLDRRGGSGDPPRSIVIDADDFALLRPWLQGAILRRAVERLGGGLKSMSAERTRAAARALLSGSVAGPVELPGGLAATRRRRAIRIEKGNAERKTANDKQQ